MACSMVFSKSLLTNVVKTFSIGAIGPFEVKFLLMWHVKMKLQCHLWTIIFYYPFETCLVVSTVLIRLPDCRKCSSSTSFFGGMLLFPFSPAEMPMERNTLLSIRGIHK